MIGLHRCEVCSAREACDVWVMPEHWHAAPRTERVYDARQVTIRIGGYEFRGYAVTYRAAPGEVT